jgi:transporter family-2 protein
MFQYVALAALAGCLLPLQSLIAARTAAVFNGPMMAALVNFAGGTVACLVLIVLFRIPWPSAEQPGMVPSYGWFAGLFGVFFVAQAAFTVPKLGAAGMIALVVAGQMVGSIVLDHFGVLQQAHPISLQKLLGALLLCIGVILILRPGN